MAEKSAPAKPGKKGTATKTPKGTAAGRTAGASKAKSGSGKVVYTKPELRDKLKQKIQSGTKGGQAGQWSARKAQLLATKYKQEGGGYKDGPSESQQHLRSWTKEKWQTATGEKAQKGKTTSRYLPKKAWEKLTPAERKATDKKKTTASRTGQQFVANTPAAKKARKAAAKS